METPHATARLLQDGPLELRGDLRLNGAPLGEEAWLCRCGASADKPWCDGSHNSAGRTLPGDAPRRDGKPLPAAAPLDIEPMPNGSVRLTGPLVLLNDAGEVVDRATQVFLCRCGRTARPPYCDGSHKRVGFVAP
jgi:CDGSH-type Zn-finger protein